MVFICGPELISRLYEMVILILLGAKSSSLLLVLLDFDLYVVDTTSFILDATVSNFFCLFSSAGVKLLLVIFSLIYSFSFFFVS